MKPNNQLHLMKGYTTAHRQIIKSIKNNSSRYSLIFIFLMIRIKDRNISLTTKDRRSFLKCSSNVSHSRPLEIFLTAKRVDSLGF